MASDLYASKVVDYFSFERRDMIRFIPRSAVKILDVGCADGSFGRLLKAQRPVQIWGIEPFADAGNQALKVLDNVVIADVEEAIGTLPRGFFDCVVFNDVLEHLYDPWDVLRRIREVMSPASCVVASIPNIRFFEVMKKLIISKRWDYADSGILDRTHVRFFTCKTIRSLFASADLELVMLQGISGGPFPWKFALLNRLFLNALDDMRYKQFACVARPFAPTSSSATSS